MVSKPRQQAWIISWRELRAEGVIRRSLLVADLERLTPLLSETIGEVDFKATLLTGEAKRNLITIEIKTALLMECQRCLTSCYVNVERSFQACVVEHESTENAESHVERLLEHLPEDCEVVLLEDGLMNVNHLIEDELLLSLPLVARHENQQDCLAQGYRTTALAEAVKVDEKTHVNPFSMLKSRGIEEK